MSEWLRRIWVVMSMVIRSRFMIISSLRRITRIRALDMSRTDITEGGEKYHVLLLLMRCIVLALGGLSVARRVRFLLHDTTTMKWHACIVT